MKTKRRKRNTKDENMDTKNVIKEKIELKIN